MSESFLSRLKVQLLKIQYFNSLWEVRFTERGFFCRKNMLKTVDIELRKLYTISGLVKINLKFSKSKPIKLKVYFCQTRGVAWK